MRTVIHAAIVTAVASVASLVHAEPPATTYRVILDEPQTQSVRIEVELTGLDENPGGDGGLDLLMPTWRPGRYTENDHANGVRWLRATTARGRPLEVRKVDKATWRVRTEGEPDISIEYDLYANDLNRRTRHVDDTHAFLSGSAVFLMPEGRRDAPCIIELEAPQEWRVASGLNAVSERNTRVLEAANYDVLVDSPIEIGIHERDRFFVGGIPHEIVIWFAGPKPEVDFDRLKEDFAKIVEVQRAIFAPPTRPGETAPEDAGMHYDRYVFLVHAGPGLGGGTEHLNSTIMQTRTSTFRSRRSAGGFYGLTSHEMFHTWNVKNFRPRGITPYNYAGPNYTTMLWLCEGGTSYYDDLTLVRAGLLEPDAYLGSALGRNIHNTREAPGRLVQSLADASFDAWIKFFAERTPDSVNSTISFYTKGALACLLLDCTIREATGNSRSLDDVMRLMNDRYAGAPRGYTPAEFRGVCEEVAGVSLERFFRDAIHGTETLWFEEVIGTIGLELSFKPNGPPDNGHATDDEGFVLLPYLGIDTNPNGDGVTVRSVRADGPAYQAGIIADDEIVAINDERLEDADLAGALADIHPGDELTIEFSRFGRMRTLTLRMGAKRDGRWTLTRVNDPTDAQRSAYESWLGQPWPGEDDDEGDDD